MEQHLLNWLEIDSSIIKKNVASIRTLAGDRLIAAALKANAYGHGLAEMISIFDSEDIQFDYSPRPVNCGTPYC